MRARRDTIEDEDGTPADPPDAQSSGARLAGRQHGRLGPGRMLRVVGTRVEEGSDGDPVSVLVVEEAVWKSH